MATGPATATPDTGRRLPLAVYILAFSLFAMGSTEFLVAGVLPALADHFDVTLSSAGAVISAFALGVVVGGPPFAVLTLRWPRRATLIASQAIFAVALAIGVLHSGYDAFLVTRFICGLAYAGYFAVAAVTAISLVPEQRTARASGLVVSGLTLAMVIGGPASAFLSHFTGWQGGFWIVVALTTIATVLTARLVPSTAPRARPSVRRELRTMAQIQLWVVLGATLLSTAAYMVTYNYLAAFLTDTTAISAVWVSPILVLFGLGAFAGISVGGRLSDRWPTHALLAGALGIAASSALLAALAHSAQAAVPLIAILGFAGFVLNPAIYGRVFTLAAHAPTLAGATTVSAFQLGISLVPVVAGVALANSGVGAIPWIGSGLAGLSVPAILVDHRIGTAKSQS